MKLRKLLNGVLACTMALSMVPVVSADEYNVDFSNQNNSSTFVEENDTFSLTTEMSELIYNASLKEIPQTSMLSRSHQEVTNLGITVYSDGLAKQSLYVEESSSDMLRSTQKAGFTIDVWGRFVGLSDYEILYTVTLWTQFNYSSTFVSVANKSISTQEKNSEYEILKATDSQKSGTKEASYSYTYTFGKKNFGAIHILSNIKMECDNNGVVSGTGSNNFWN